MIEWLQNWLVNDNTKLFYVLSCILVANVLDFLAGFINAWFNPKVKFSSKEALYGLARKMLLFMLMAFFIPVSQILPSVIQLPSLYVMYLGYLSAEIYSIASHMGMANDPNKPESLLINLIKRVFSNTMLNYGSSHDVTKDKEKGGK